MWLIALRSHVSHRGSQEGSHTRDRWPHEAIFMWLTTQLPKCSQVPHTLSSLSLVMSQPESGPSMEQHMQSHSDTHAPDPLGMLLGGDPERNTNYKHIPHNHPPREAWVLSCCGWPWKCCLRSSVWKTGKAYNEGWDKGRRQKAGTVTICQ